MAKTKRKFATKATNAYDLLKEVRALILEEPKRYNQDKWVELLDAYSDGYSFAGVTLDSNTRPSCNTVGCVAGWVHELAYHDPRSLTYQHEVRERAINLLGITSKQADTFFAPGDECGLGSSYGQWGTEEYARKGARRITVFMAHHKKQLKAKRITPTAR